MLLNGITISMGFQILQARFQGTSWNAPNRSQNHAEFQKNPSRRRICMPPSLLSTVRMLIFWTFVSLRFYFYHLQDFCISMKQFSSRGEMYIFIEHMCHYLSRGVKRTFTEMDMYYSLAELPLPFAPLKHSPDILFGLSLHMTMTNICFAPWPFVNGAGRTTYALQISLFLTHQSEVTPYTN